MASGYIEFIDNDVTFEHRWSDKASLTLRVVPDDVEAQFRKDNREVKWKHGQQSIEIDSNGFIADCLDYAIRGWTGVRRRDPNTGESIEVACTRENKVKLPEAVQSDVVRLCVAREAGNVIGEKAAADAKKS